MSEQLRERLYELLPQLYRQRDALQGQPLRALMAVLDAEFDTLEGDIVALYDNWFVETADNWVLPYLADLVAAGPVGDGQRWHYTERRRIANTIAYRRRQGTVATLENVIRDTTGWAVKVVEDARYVSATQHVRHLRLEQQRLADVRDAVAVRGVKGPFNRVTHTAEIPCRRQSPDVHWPAPGAPPRTYFPGGTTIHLWRLRPFQMQQVTPCLMETIALAANLRARCFTFDPLGFDRQLFAVPENHESLDEETSIRHLPVPIGRTILTRDLRGAASTGRESVPHATDAPLLPQTSSTTGRSIPALPHGRPQPSAPPGQADRSFYYGRGRSLDIAFKPIGPPPGEIEGSYRSLPRQAVLSGDLSVWPDAGALRREFSPGAEPRAVVDVRTGRFLVIDDPTAASQVGDELLVDYAYGFSSDMGGGPYGRGFKFAPGATHVWRVSRRLATAAPDAAGGESPLFTDLDEALRAWNAQARRFEQRAAAATGSHDPDVSQRELHGQVQILDNATYEVQTGSLEMPPGANLVIAAADEMRPAIRLRQPLQINTACHLEDHVAAEPNSDLASERSERLHPPTRLDLHGLLIAGGLRVTSEEHAHAGALDLGLAHSTLVPSPQAPALAADAGVGRLRITHSIVGRLELRCRVQAEISESLIDAAGQGTAIGGVALRGDEAHAMISAKDLVSRPAVAMSADLPAFPVVELNCVTVLGKLRDVAIPAATNVLFTHPLAESQRGGPDSVDDGTFRFCHLPASAARRDDLNGAFTSTAYGHAAYGQLGQHCPVEILRAGQDGSQPGAFHRAYRPQRLSGLQRMINEFAPLGLELKIAYVT